ncbi:MAG: histidine phosphatase family protein [Alphaproteobacteria bacterium]
MKRLLILRHAQAGPASEGSDRERKLTTQGMEDASALGERMKAENYIPDFILCSPVTRTQQTLDGVLGSLGKIQTEFEKTIYEGGYGELLSLVRGVDDSCMTLLLIGHNPAIHQFAASLALEEGEFINRLAFGYAPATLTVLDVPRASWRDLQPGENKISDLIES